jgi:hypothetical protein
MKLKALTLAAIFLIIGCKAQDDSLTRPPVVYGTQEIGARGETVRYEPKVDMVFIVDDSDSMLNHQENLRRNVPQLVAGLASSKIINFHIGVMQIWDSYRYSHMPAVCPADGHRSYEAEGGLMPLKAPQGQESFLKNFSQRFVSRGDGFSEVLGASIELGENTLRHQPCEEGPEVEEILPVIMATLDNNPSQNQGFFRDDAFKVFIILSDALEGSDMDANFVNLALRAKYGAPAVGGQDKFRVYSVVMKPKTVISNSCKADPGFHLHNGDTVPEHPLSRLSELANGDDNGVLSICAPDYGTQLLAFGKEIKKATLKNVKVPVPYAPNFNDKDLPEDKRFQVKLGGEILTQGTYHIDVKTGQATIDSGDWVYRQWLDDSKHMQREILVRGDLANWEKDPSAQIEVIEAPIVRRQGTTTKQY